MALRLEDKQALVAEVNEVAANSESVGAAEYRGLSVAQMTEFRVKARSEGVYVRVIKNTLAKRAIQGTDYECLAEVLKGPLLLAFSREDPGAAARVIKDFAKANSPVCRTLTRLGVCCWVSCRHHLLSWFAHLLNRRQCLPGYLVFAAMANLRPEPVTGRAKIFINEYFE